MGSVHCEVVFSMFLLHLSSKKEMHFISSAWHGLLCYYFRNNLGICQSQLPNLQCQASLPINKAEALRRQLHSDYSTSRQAFRVHYISTWIYRGLIWSSRRNFCLLISMQKVRWKRGERESSMWISRLPFVLQTQAIYRIFFYKNARFLVHFVLSCIVGQNHTQKFPVISSTTNLVRIFSWFLKINPAPKSSQYSYATLWDLSC